MALAFAFGPAHLALAGATASPPPAPEVVDDAYAATEDEVLHVPAPGVMANDNPLPESCVVGAQFPDDASAIELLADGSFDYTPPANFHGETSFSYALVVTGPCVDAVSINLAVVRITVAAVNDAPTAGADSFIVLKDRTLNVGAPGVLINDHDVDGDSLTAQRGEPIDDDAPR